MRTDPGTRVAAAALALLCLFTLSPLAAQERMMIQVGYGAGGGFDAVARIVAEHLPRHLPGSPDIIVENVPGAGSLVLARMVMADRNPRGTRIAMVGSALALLPVFEPDNAVFDPLAVHYLASMSSGASYCFADRRSGIETLEQLLASPHIRVGASGRQSTTYIYPAALRAALGGQFQIVIGFPGTADIDLAMERGDIHVRCGGGLDQIRDTGREDRVTVIAEMAVESQREIVGVTFALDLAPDQETRDALSLIFMSTSIHHPFIAPPATTPEAVATLRAAFRAMFDDPDFRELNARRLVPLSLRPGEEVEARIRAALAQPDHVQALARALVE
jgi:tripartite-type tricarboxylate transporter receptor subunit TctC